LLYGEFLGGFLIFPKGLPFSFGFSFLGKYLIGGDLLFDGGVVKTY
jgi:hypothetical protein